jgi:adenosylhomocysteine nucleosidase
MRIVLVAAFRSEASGILGLLDNVTRGKTGGVKFWQGGVGAHEISVVLCGAGPEKAAVSLGQAAGIITEAELVINFGVCGALREDTALGRIVVMESVAAVWRAEEAPLDLLQPDVGAADACAGAHLVTHSRPVFDSRVASRLASRFAADYVDMEAWEVASFARQRNIPVAVVKAVSDRADEKSAEDFAAHARDAATNCAQAVYEILLKL